MDQENKAESIDSLDLSEDLKEQDDGLNGDQEISLSDLDLS